MTLPDVDQLSTYGAPFVNYDVGPIDPTTDLDANQFNRLAATVAAASRMVDRCEVAFTAGTTPTILSHESVWRAATPTPPTVARIGTGRFRVFVPSTVYDELGVAHAISLRSAKGQIEGGLARHVQAMAVANYIEVYIFDLAGVVSDATGLVVRVWAR